VTVEHIPKDIAIDVSSALRGFKVWGRRTRKGEEAPVLLGGPYTYDVEEVSSSSSSSSSGGGGGGVSCL